MLTTTWNLAAYSRLQCSLKKMIATCTDFREFIQMMISLTETAESISMQRSALSPNFLLDTRESDFLNSNISLL